MHFIDEVGIFDAHGSLVAPSGLFKSRALVYLNHTMQEIMEGTQ